jgi:hypothetical protein
MKRFLFSAILAYQCSAYNAIAQGNQHLTVAPLSGSRAVTLSALNIERGTSYPSVIQLKGNVEIKTPVCLPAGRKNALVCDGEVILQADSAEFHEDTGQIEAHGTVTVIPIRKNLATK